MDTRTFEMIKSKIEVLKQKKAKAEGAVESILTNWKATYGFTSLAEAEKQLEMLSGQQNATEAKIEDLFNELKGLTNWNLI